MNFTNHRRSLSEREKKNLEFITGYPVHKV